MSLELRLIFRMANDLIIDDRSSGNLKSNLGFEWPLVTDQVMGGVSSGQLTLDTYRGKNCLRMRGDVSTANNGGFVQMALSLSDEDYFDSSAFTGIIMEVAGNNEDYNMHLRTSNLRFPWQSYRASFKATLIGKLSAFLFPIWMPTKHQRNSARIN